MKDWIERLGTRIGRHPGTVDLVITAVVVAAGVALALTEYRFIGVRPEDRQPPVPPSGWLLVAVIGTIAPVALRRRLPLSAFVVGASVAAVALLTLRAENEITALALLMLLYSASAYGSPARRAAVCLVTGAVFTAVSAYRVGSSNLVMSAVFAVHLVVWQVAAYMLGHSVRVGRERQVELTRRTEQLATERELNARRAVLVDRVRIARELHDVIAHHVSLMGIQAAAARRVLSARPEQAVKALESIEGSSREAVGELHRMVGFLRENDEDDFLAPPPGLRRLDGLIDQLGDTTLAVDVRVEGDQVDLPASVDLSAYRVVQEALTNTLKHARASSAEVTLRYRPALFEIEVRDDGGAVAGASAASNGGGHGLVGMRERVALHGGRFEAGPRAGGGFGVHAAFPLKETM